MRYNSSRRETCPRLVILAAFFLLALTTSTLLPASLFAGPLRKDRSFKIKIEETPDFTFTIFGWVQIQSGESSPPNPLLTVLKSNLDDFDKPDNHEAGDDSNAVSVLQLQNDRLVLSVKPKFFNSEGSEAAMELKKEVWYFLTYTFDRQKKTATVILTNPLGDSDDFEVNLAVPIPDCQLTGFIEATVELGKDDHDHSKKEAKFRDFSLVSSLVKNPRLLYLLQSHTDSHYVDYILSVKSIDEINNFRSTIRADIKQHKIGFEGTNIRSTENGWIALKEGSYVEFPAIPMPSSPGHNHSIAIYLKLKLTGDLSDNFTLLSSAGKFNASAVNFELRLVLNAGSSRQVLLYFPAKQREIKTDITVETDVIQELFVAFNFLGDSLDAVVIRTGDGDYVFPVKFKCQLKQAVFWVLPPSREFFTGEVTLYRMFASQNVHSVLESAIIGNSPQETDTSCLMPADYASKTEVKCLVCQKTTLLNPLTHRCETKCAEGRRESHGICIECTTSDCSEVAPAPGFEISRIRSNKFKIKVNSQTNREINLKSISDDFEFYADSDLQKKLGTNKKMLEAEELVFELLGEPQNYLQKEIVVKLNRRLLGDSQEAEPVQASWLFSPVSGMQTLPTPQNFPIDKSLNPTENVKPQSGSLVIKIFAFVVIGIFGIGLLFGFAGCLLPFSLPVSSFFHQKVIQTGLTFQFICFWALYPGVLASSFGEFLSYLFEYAIGVQQLFTTPENQLPMANNQNAHLRSHNISSSFVNNMTIALIVQAAVIVIFFTLSLFEKGDSIVSCFRLDGPSSKMTFSRWVFTTKWRAIFTVFLMMTTEIVLFATIQFFNWSFSNVVNIVSFAVAVLLCVILLTQLIIATVHAVKTRDHINDVSSLAFVSSSLRSGLRRLFFPIQTCFYIVFALTFVMPFGQAWIPIVINYSVTTLLGIIGALRFPEKNYWRNEQTVSHILLWLAKTFFVIMKFESMHEFMNESVSRILSYGAILFTSLAIIWNSSVTAESLIREVTAEKKRMHLQSLFVIRTVGIDDSFQKANKSAVFSIDKTKNSLEVDRSFVRFSAKNIYSYSEKRSEFSKLKTAHSAEVLVKDDDAIKTKLASLNFPSKLAHLKFCQFPSSEKIGSFQSLSDKKFEDSKESSPNQNYVIKIANKEGTEVVLNQGTHFSPNKKDSQNENSKSKASTQDTSRLRPMSQEISFSASEHIFDSDIKDPSPADLKFNQILTQSKLVKLKDSVSFVKKRHGESELDASNTERTILPANYYSSRVIGGRTDNELAPISRATNFSNIRYVCDEYANDDDTKTINELNNGFELGGSQSGTDSLLDLSQMADSDRFLSGKNIGRNAY